MICVKAYNSDVTRATWRLQSPATGLCVQQLVRPYNDIEAVQHWPFVRGINPWMLVTLQWRHNGRDSVSNHQPHDSLLNRLLRRKSKKTSKLRVTGLCAGNSPIIGEFPAQMASNAENVFIWWRHHVSKVFPCQDVVMCKYDHSCRWNQIWAYFTNKFHLKFNSVGKVIFLW